MKLEEEVARLLRSHNLQPMTGRGGTEESARGAPPAAANRTRPARRRSSKRPASARARVGSDKPAKAGAVTRRSKPRSKPRSQAAATAAADKAKRTSRRSSSRRAGKRSSRRHHEPNADELLLSQSHEQLSQSHEQLSQSHEQPPQPTDMPWNGSAGAYGGGADPDLDDLGLEDDSLGDDSQAEAEIEEAMMKQTESLLWQ